MNFLIITHVSHKKIANQFLAYAPYVREMNLWGQHISQMTIVAPITSNLSTAIDLAYSHPRIHFIAIPPLDFTSVLKSVRSAIYMPVIIWKIFISMWQADHIHLRCPGNMGLIGCLTQIFFPNKPKTAKYAGNWDWNSKQPWSYRLQQLLLRNTLLTRHMTALVYGDWPDRTRNILPFYTASYQTQDICNTPPRALNEEIRLIFVGTLTLNKNPLTAIQVVEALHQKGVKVRVDLFGAGNQTPVLQQYIQSRKLEQITYLHGNVSPEVVKQAYQQSHFLIFLSRSEGWPKAVAEAMFWGCLPLTSSVSCVPQMLAQGERGDLIPNDPAVIVERILHYLDHPEAYQSKANAAMEWSRTYTMDRFETDIAQILKG